MSYTNNYKSAVPVVTTTPAKIADFNDNRKVLLLFNQGAVAVRIYFDSTNGTKYIEIPAGNGLNFFSNAPMNEIYAVTASGSVNLAVIEG